MLTVSKTFKTLASSLLVVLFALFACAAAGAFANKEFVAGIGITGLALLPLAGAFLVVKLQLAPRRPMSLRIRQRSGFSRQLFIRAFLWRTPRTLVAGYLLYRTARLVMSESGALQALAFGVWAAAAVLTVLYALVTLKVARAAFDPYVEAPALRPLFSARRSFPQGKRPAARRFAAGVAAASGAAAVGAGLHELCSTDPFAAGVDSTGSCFSGSGAMDDSWAPSAGYGMDDWNSGPSVNVDGTPMVGSVDIHGNPYGITSDSFESSSDFFSSDSIGSSFDSFGSSDPFSSDTFGSSLGSFSNDL